MQIVAGRKRPAHAAQRRTRVGAPVASDARTLADLAPGETGVVARVEAPDPRVARRLAALGFRTGTPVSLVRVAPLGDPLLVRIAGYELALRRTQARCLQLQPEESA